MLPVLLTDSVPGRPNHSSRSCRSETVQSGPRLTSSVRADLYATSLTTLRPRHVTHVIAWAEQDCSIAYMPHCPLLISQTTLDGGECCAFNLS
jgi:hypothetical protein